MSGLQRLARPARAVASAIAVLASIFLVLAIVVTAAPADASTTSTNDYDGARSSGPGPARRIDMAHGPQIGVNGHPIHHYDIRVQLARTSASRVAGFLAPQTSPGECDGDKVVVGESTRRASEAAARFGARYWDLEGQHISHWDLCHENEAWLRSEIAAGTHIIDIGIDTSRIGSRSPYYELEQQIIAETGYPVDRRPWPASPNEYRAPGVVPVMGEHQQTGKWTTPFGPNVRYTVRLHVVGEDRDERGTARGADRHVEYRVVTPHGQLKAAASAAAHLAREEPGSIFREIEIVAVEEEFDLTPEDYRDVDSFGR